jgi:GTP cyclohydrolase I
MDNLRRYVDPHAVDIAEAATHYEEFLRSLGIWDLMEEEPRARTPARVVQAYLEFFGNNLAPLNFTTFPVTNPDQMVVVSNISFASLCAHHHLPFHGVCHVGYVPLERVCGLSKIPRVVEHLTHGAMIQEDVTTAIAQFLWEQLSPMGVAVLMEAEHTCMSLRGVRKPGHTASTLEYRGCFLPDHSPEFAAFRADFLSRILPRR